MNNQPIESILKKRRKKRFTSRDQIIQRIDKFTRKAARQRASQTDCYLKAAQHRRHGQECDDVDSFNKAKEHDARGDGWGRKADRLERDVLPKLRAKLAEFDTETIPGITNDRSIPGL